MQDLIGSSFSIPVKVLTGITERIFSRFVQNPHMIILSGVIAISDEELASNKTRSVGILNW